MWICFVLLIPFAFSKMNFDIFQESSDEDGKNLKDIPEAFGSKANVRVSVVSQESESKEDDSEESANDSGKNSDKEKNEKESRKSRNSAASNNGSIKSVSVSKLGAKEPKSDKDRIKAATMTTSKKVGIDIN